MILAVRRDEGAHVPSAHAAGCRPSVATNPIPNKTAVSPRNHGRYGSSRMLAAPSAPAPTSEKTTGPRQQAEAATAATTDPMTAFIAHAPLRGRFSRPHVLGIPSSYTLYRSTESSQKKRRLRPASGVRDPWFGRAGNGPEQAAVEQMADERSDRRHHAARGTAEQPAAHHRHDDDLGEQPQRDAPQASLDDRGSRQDPDEGIRVDGRENQRAVNEMHQHPGRPASTEYGPEHLRDVHTKTHHRRHHVHHRRHGERSD